jgi:hypothetical protein
MKPKAAISNSLKIIVRSIRKNISKEVGIISK